MWALCSLSVKGDWCLQKQFVALLWVWLGSYSKYYLNSFHQLMFTANLIFCFGGGKKTEGKERSEVFRLYFQASNCLFEQSLLTPFSFVMSLWYLLLDPNLHPKGLPIAPDLKTPWRGQLTMRGWPLRLPLCDITLYKDQREQRRGKGRCFM